MNKHPSTQFRTRGFTTNIILVAIVIVLAGVAVYLSLPVQTITYPPGIVSPSPATTPLPQGVQQPVIIKSLQQYQELTPLPIYTLTYEGRDFVNDSLSQTTYYKSGNNVRIDGDFGRIYILNTTQYNCDQKSSSWKCSQCLEPGLLGYLPHQINYGAPDPNGYVYSGAEKIAGIDASCFKKDTSSPSGSAITHFLCLHPSKNLALKSLYLNQFNNPTAESKAQTVSFEAIHDDIFRLPTQEWQPVWCTGHSGGRG